ncbi:MAG: Rv2578c family radical SAM protein [Streptosporangiaceae bacterium]
MRWDGQLIDEPAPAGQARPAQEPRFDAQAALFGRDVVARTFDTPGFRGMTFYEVYAKSIINKVPPASRMPFQFTINPYRGCGHACVYCFARNTHTYLELDSGLDFNSKIIVKVNAAELARRDLDLLEDAAQVTSVALNISVGFADAELSASVEPGTPSPQRRLDACAAVTQRGMRCGILMGPVLPFLSDSPNQLAETVRQAAAAGATSVTPIVLHLRPGAREWYLNWLSRQHPSLVPRYRKLYGPAAYAPKDYQRKISARVGELAAKYRVGSASPARARRVSPPDRPGGHGTDDPADGVQLSLI